MATIVQSFCTMATVVHICNSFHVNDKSVVFMIDSSFALFSKLPEKYPFCVTERGGVSFGSNQYTYNRAFVVTSTQNHLIVHLFNIIKILNKYKIFSRSSNQKI